MTIFSTRERVSKPPVRNLAAMYLRSNIFVFCFLFLCVFRDMWLFFWSTTMVPDLAAHFPMAAWQATLQPLIWAASVPRQTEAFGELRFLNSPRLARVKLGVLGDMLIPHGPTQAMGRLRQCSKGRKSKQLFDNYLLTWVSMWRLFWHFSPHVPFNLKNMSCLGPSVSQEEPLAKQGLVLFFCPARDRAQPLENENLEGGECQRFYSRCV